MKPDDIITIREVADYLKIAEKTAYKLVLEGIIPGFKVGGSWRFKRDEIAKWVEKQGKAVKKKHG
ncbi:MAG: helix-turn-helix domain-containing protein [Alphaproteobacteria bacterium]|nr:helix-turn-helix domain-containing protein [Alphaproteobacteria bacterium]